MALAKKIYYVTQAQYDALYASGAKNGTVTVGTSTYAYESDAVYLIQEAEPAWTIVNSGSTQVDLAKNGVLTGNAITVPYAVIAGSANTALGIATAVNASLVHISTSETISGDKTFTGNLTIADNGSSTSISGAKLVIGDDAYIKDIDLDGTFGVMGKGNVAYGGIEFGMGGPVIGRYDGTSNVIYKPEQYSTSYYIMLHTGNISSQSVAYAVSSSYLSSARSFSLTGDVTGTASSDLASGFAIAAAANPATVVMISGAQTITGSKVFSAASTSFVSSINIIQSATSSSGCSLVYDSTQKCVRFVFS
jgi:hypothetical protein